MDQPPKTTFYRRARKRAFEDLHALTADEVFQVGQLGDGSIPVEEQHGPRERSHLLPTFNSDLESLEPDEAQRADLRPQQISESSGSELSSSETDEFDRVDFQPGDNPESSGTEFESSEANEFDRADLQPQNIPESSSRYEEERNCEDADVHESIVGKLRTWALDTATPHRALTELLKILQTHSCFASIPGSARSLLKTPRKACVEKMGAGKYCHFGLKEGLEDTLKRARSVPDVITINVNIDGLPLTKSTRDQFWPVLCHVTNCGKCDPFPIGVYYGKSKAVCAEEFLRPAVSDIIEALSDGLIFKGRHLRIELSALICDAPAKSYVLGIKGHNGYFSCTKCQTEGDFLNGRMCFPQLDATLRTDGSFRSHAQEEHHLQRTELEKLPIDLVKNVPLDYMHLVCLGVVSKLLRLWLKGDSRCRLGTAARDAISLANLEIERYVCSDFGRKPRSLLDLDRWKAVEFRLLVLYTGPIVLYSRVPDPFFFNFMTLHAAITILCSPKLCLEYVDYSEQLLVHFVETYISLYGRDKVSHNVHNLIHIANDVRTHGPLDGWSAFPFENFMGTLKAFQRKPERPLEQLYNRIAERRSMFAKKEFKDKNHFFLEHDNGPLTVGCEGPQYKAVQIPHKFTLRTRINDNTCMLNDGDIIMIQNFAFCSTSGQARVIGKRLSSSSDLYTHPCPSSMLGVVLACNPSVTKSWPLSDVAQKCVRMPYKGKFAIFPLLHLQ
ncbi:unnamed protein product [Ixodes pacificus]